MGVLRIVIPLLAGFAVLYAGHYLFDSRRPAAYEPPAFVVRARARLRVRRHPAEPVILSRMVFRPLPGESKWAYARRKARADTRPHR